MNSELTQIAKDLAEGKNRQATVRTLLSWFNAERRGYWISRTIRDGLKEAGLVTNPDFEVIYIDSEVQFQLSPQPSLPSQQSSDKPESSRLEARDLDADPLPRIGLLKSANQPPVSITPDAEITQAATLMMVHDFSQLPVIQGDRNVKGMISWKAIGQAAAAGKSTTYVRDVMDTHVEIVQQDAPLFEAVATIISNGVVLVKGGDSKICGIVTGEDINSQFLELSEAFLRLGEIENQLRRLIRGKFSAAELQDAGDPSDTTRKINDVSDLTFGEYIRIFENPTNWSKLGLRLDRSVFVTQLNHVRKIRNDVMHFHPDGIEEEERKILRRISHFLRQL